MLEKFLKLLGHTPLYAAARVGLIDVVIKLLNIPGVDPDSPTLGGHTPLHGKKKRKKNRFLLKRCEEERNK